MNRDSVYSIIFICALILYAILLTMQIKRIIQEKRYRKFWITGSIILSSIICLLGILTSLNIALAILAAIIILIIINIKENISIKEK